MDDAPGRAAMGDRGRELARRLFSPATAVAQIVAGMTRGGARRGRRRAAGGSPA